VRRIERPKLTDLPDSKQWAGRPPKGALILDEPAVIECDGQPVAAYLDGFEAEATLIGSMASRGEVGTTWGKSRPGTNEARLSGVVVGHAVFGYVPPVPLRRRWGGSLALLHDERPDLGDALTDAASVAYDAFLGVLRTNAVDTARAVSTVVAEAWRIPGSPWTSGILNNTTSHPYHRDSGNVKGSWSAMLGARRWCDGGLLHLAEFDVWLPIEHGSLTLFDGQATLHGVSPLDRHSPRAYRYTAVYYAKRGLAPCDPDPSREPRRAALAATLRDVNVQLPADEVTA
jgi:hypothetical protein